MIAKKGCILVIVLLFITGLLMGCNNKDEEVNLKNAAIKAKAEPYAHPDSLISAEQLKQLLGQPDLTIVDARARDVYEQGHIPGAICYNMRALFDPNRPGRFTSPKLFSLSIREFGINSTDHIVVYSDNYNDARLWFFLNMYGLNTQLLNGGFDQWQSKGYELEGGRVRRPYKGQFKISDEQLKIQAIAETAEIASALGDTTKNIIIDARSAEEFSGQGHIPGAVNITWSQFINEDKTFKSTSQLKEIFLDQQVTPDKQVFIYSNTAARASHVYFVLTELLGYPQVKVYDGFRLYWYREKPMVTGSN